MSIVKELTFSTSEVNEDSSFWDNDSYYAGAVGIREKQPSGYMEDWLTPETELESIFPQLFFGTGDGSSSRDVPHGWILTVWSGSRVNGLNYLASRNLICDPFIGTEVFVWRFVTNPVPVEVLKLASLSENISAIEAYFSLILDITPEPDEVDNVLGQLAVSLRKMIQDVVLEVSK